MYFCLFFSKILFFLQGEWDFWKKKQKMDQFLTYKKGNLGPVFKFTAYIYIYIYRRCFLRSWLKSPGRLGPNRVGRKGKKGGGRFLLKAPSTSLHRPSQAGCVWGTSPSLPACLYILSLCPQSETLGEIDSWESLYQSLLEAPRTVLRDKLRILHCYFTFLDLPSQIQEATGYEPNDGSCANKALYLLWTPAIATSPTASCTGSSHWHCQCLTTVFMLQHHAPR